MSEFYILQDCPSDQREAYLATESLGPVIQPNQPCSQDKLSGRSYLWLKYNGCSNSLPKFLIFNTYDHDFRGVVKA